MSEVVSAEDDDGGVQGFGLYPIRTVSRRTGVPSVTLRAWERRYRLITPTRTEKGHRLYTEADIERVRQVLALIEQGVGVGQVGPFLARAANDGDLVRSTNDGDLGWGANDGELGQAGGEARIPVMFPGTDPWPAYIAAMLEGVRRFDTAALDAVYNDALSLYPIMYLNASAALANLDPAMEEAAANLGCSSFRKFRKITLPLMMPGLFAGGTIVFIWSFTELGTPLIMNYTKCASVQVFDALKEIGSNPFPYALVFVMLACSVSIYLVGKFLFGGQAYAMQSKAATVSATSTVRGWRGLLALLPFAAVILVALTPHLGVVATSLAQPGTWYQSVLPTVFTLQNYAEALGHEMTVGSIRNSLLYSSLAVLFNTVLGIAIAYVVVRSSIKWRGLLDALAMLPLAVPGLVMAFGYLAISSQLSNADWVKNSTFWPNLLDVRTNPTLFLVIAYSIRRLPYVVRSAVAGLQQTSVTLEEAAANLGAGLLTTLRRITLPLITANLIAGALLAFAFSMLEVSDSLMLAQRADFYPITKTIYELFQLIGTGQYIASALGVWAMVFLAVTILGASLILGKKMGALFRA